MVAYGREALRLPLGRGLGTDHGGPGNAAPHEVSRARHCLAGRPARIAQSQRILASLLDEDLATWGYSRAELESELAAIDPAAPQRGGAALTRYRLERKLLVRLRRNIHQNAFGRLVRRVRRVCDVLLR